MTDTNNLKEALENKATVFERDWGGDLIGK